MSVTLEQCNILIAEHSMKPSILQQALDAMRRVGVRRENLFKNIGEKRWVAPRLPAASLFFLRRSRVVYYSSRP